MNCATHCALCGTDLQLMNRAYWRELEVSHLARSLGFRGMWENTEEPKPLTRDEDGDPICPCTGERR